MKNLIPVSLVYAGLALMLVGATLLVWPLPVIAVQRRSSGAVILVIGALILVAGAIFPAAETEIPTPLTKLDEFAPKYQFNEIHSIEVNTSKQRTYCAIRHVTAGEIRLLRTLTWIRRFGRSSSPGILNAPQNEPVLDIAMRSGFLLLADDPQREIVIGTLARAPVGWRAESKFTPDDFKLFATPGFAVASMNFRIEVVGPEKCKVTTETRVYATDPSSRRNFGEYWRVIYPGSALIRRMWLQAIKKRAEAAESP